MAPPKTIIIVGGGTAGWLSAGLLAAKKTMTGEPYFKVKVIEPVDIGGIGVGEGTWPTMRRTLFEIGVSEKDFLKSTGASFKQGTKFINWRHNQGEYYYHPFDAPNCQDNILPLDSWLDCADLVPFAQYVGMQEILCENFRAPKLPTSPDFAGITNYGYHFEADGLAKFLKHHCQEKLSVELIPDRMRTVNHKEDGHIKSILTHEHGEVSGNIFVDCTGFQSLLLRKHYKPREISLNHIFFNDRAVAARVPYHEKAEIESTTLSTARNAGWIWDVSLQKRFGVGYVHSSAHASSEVAHEDLASYLEGKGYDPGRIMFRELKFNANYIDECWIGNCIAIGLSSGFVEPLEASSIMMTELAARELATSLSADDYNEKSTILKFNKRYKERWEQVIHFLKFHYALSQREDVYWRDSRAEDTLPDRLLRDLLDWNKNGLSTPFKGGIFPAESYQFVYHALTHRPMTHRPMAHRPTTHRLSDQSNLSRSQLQKYQPRLSEYLRLLPTNRAWLDQVK